MWNQSAKSGGLSLERGQHRAERALANKCRPSRSWSSPIDRLKISAPTNSGPATAITAFMIVEMMPCPLEIVAGQAAGADQRDDETRTPMIGTSRSA